MHFWSAPKVCIFCENIFFLKIYLVTEKNFQKRLEQLLLKKNSTEKNFQKKIGAIITEEKFYWKKFPKKIGDNTRFYWVTEKNFQPILAQKMPAIFSAVFMVIFAK